MKGTRPIDNREIRLVSVYFNSTFKAHNLALSCSANGSQCFEKNFTGASHESVTEVFLCFFYRSMSTVSEGIPTYYSLYSCKHQLIWIQIRESYRMASDVDIISTIKVESGVLEKTYRWAFLLSMVGITFYRNYIPLQWVAHNGIRSLIYKARFFTNYFKMSIFLVAKKSPKNRPTRHRLTYFIVPVPIHRRLLL